MTEFTKGPWVFVPPGDRRPTDMGGFYSESGEEVCSFGDCTQFYPIEGEPPEIHDAHLIASAPDLYEALELVMRFADLGKRFDDSQLSEEGQALTLARTAIAKARGEVVG